MSHELFHPTCKRSAPCRSTSKRKKARAPRSKASDADRKRQERAPSPPSSADATGQALSKKARALACIRPFVHSVAAPISAPAPAQQLKCQPLAFDDSSRKAAAASGLAIAKVFFEDRIMERSTKVDDAERKRQRRAASPSERGRRSERAPRSKARDADRRRQERAPSRTSSADVTGQTSSKKHALLGPKPETQNTCVRRVRQVPHLAAQ